MPIKIADSLPARAVLESENIFVMTEHRKNHFGADEVLYQKSL